MDGATFKVADLLMGTGNMPNLKSIIDSGVHAYLESTTPWHSGPAWTTCTTGVQPAKHGVFNFLKMDGPLSQKPVQTGDVGAERVWSILNRHGFTTGIFNVPLTYPPDPVNGFMISGTPQSCRGMHPPELLKKYSLQSLIIQNQSAFIDNQLVPELIFKKRTDDDTARLEILSDILSDDMPDFLMSVFTSTDEIQHCFWHYFDQEHPFSGKDARPNMDKIIPVVYMNMDKILGNVLELAAGPDTTVIIVSDHGFGSAGKILFPNKLLADWGYFSPSSNTIIKDDMSTRNVSHYLGFDPGETRAYMTASIYGFFADIILLSSGGRLARDTLSKHNYEELKNNVSNSFLSFQDTDTGESPVKEIYSGADLFGGKYENEAADLILYCPGYNCLPRFSLDPPVCLNTPWLYDTMAQTGTHEQHGVFATRGPGINRDNNRTVLSIADVSAIALSTFGIPVPDHFDGCVPPGLFTPDYLDSLSPVTELSPPPKRDNTPPDDSLSEDEEERIRNNLKGLGYLE